MSRNGPAEHPLLGMPRRDATTTLVLSTATAILFVLMAFHGPRAAVQRVDDRWLQLMLDARSRSLTSVAKVFNVLGLVYVIWPLRVAVTVFLVLRRRLWHLAAFALAVVLSETAIGTLKSIYDRPRPPGSLVEVTAGSFPSGHAVAASATVVAIVIALFPEGPSRYWWGLLAVAFSLAMGLSRTYLAAHWLSDSIGGTLLGTSIALGSALVVHTIRERRHGSTAVRPREPAGSAAGLDR
jgi:undecaprenyl-diphosphatase